MYIDMFAALEKLYLSFRKKCMLCCGKRIFGDDICKVYLYKVVNVLFLELFVWQKKVIEIFDCIPVIRSWWLTPQHWEMYVYMFSIVATDALVLKHQAISINSADKMFIVLNQLHTKI